MSNPMPNPEPRAEQPSGNIIDITEQLSASDEDIAFGSPQDYLAWLQECGLASLLGADQHTPFLAESTFLQHWNAQLDGLPEENGLEDLDGYTLDDAETLIQIHVAYYDSSERIHDDIYINYIIDPDTGRYAVQIIQNDVLMYSRSAEQDERTEWELNSMANDVTDENGDFVFEGEPTNI